ncbi:D-alanyl-lipoteichoic acid biosynthesis protein DltD [Fodinisporobacter ferrooxydans]|uniref:Protein DltD n=1 Tax=Fodinisporobacter ferrooxydans TaxID=2901836 RepID=A0ABY4CGS8_9BACL|nr:D-alanyl-lipoteichoic acid biosynthesis protein DltD [Alicyclobacillaceae bacterium MYW30-H2]
MDRINMDRIKKPAFGPLIAALAILLILLFFPVSFAKKLLTNQDIEKVAASADLAKFKNVFLQKEAFSMNQKFLPFFGSSTIGIFSRYHPVNFFSPNQFAPYLVGQPGCTNIIHVMDFSALSGNLYHKKLVFMLDTSEFMNPNGIGDQGFSKFYSPLNGYEFLFNDEIRPQDKKQVAEQLLKYAAVKKDGLLATILEGITHDSLSYQIKADFLKPIAYLRMKLLEKQDFIQSLQLVNRIQPYHQQFVPRNLPWNQLRSMAIQEAKPQTNNNPYGMLDGFYKQKVQKFKGKLKDSWKPNHMNYLHSVAYVDLQAILDVLKSEHADPVFVLIPQKGAWDDYKGFTNSYRNLLYNKIVNEVKAEGFQVLDYRNHQYDKYFLRDFWHLGWTGWVQVDHDLANYMKQK